MLKASTARVRCLILFLLPATLLVGADAANRPNFVFFLTDDQPFNGLSCTGNTVVKTPAMDQIAADGVFFENAFVSTAICCCSRASILTGQYMRRHGVKDFETPLTTEQLHQIFPVLLRQSGYRTGFLGKFAVGSPKIDEKRSLPADLFDLWYGFPQNISYLQKENGKDRYLTTVMTEKAVDFLKTKKSDQPFFLMVALKEPHGPLTYFDPDFPKPYVDAVIPHPANLTRPSFEALPELVRKGLNAEPRWLADTRNYDQFVRQRYAYIARADLAIAQIRAALREQGLDKNTVIVFMSDNGTMDGAHALSGKWIMHEESIHVPLMISDPRLPASTRGKRTGMVLNVDLATTILNMAGVAVPARMQGIDLQPMLKSPTAKVRDDWYYEHVYTEAGRPPIPKTEGIRTERWKYTRYTDTNPRLEQLFDLRADPSEEKDLAGDTRSAQVLGQLRARCDELRRTLQ